MVAGSNGDRSMTTPVPHDWVDVDQDTGCLALVERVSQGKRIIPMIVFEGYIMQDGAAQ
jgi:hypothetical protein